MSTQPVYAVWSMHTSRITFDTAGGSQLHDFYTTGTWVWVDDLGIPTKPGYAFVYWTLDGNRIFNSFSLSPRRDITLVAVWRSSFTITFTVNHWFITSTPPPQTVPALGNATAPWLPDVDENTLFAGWSVTSQWLNPSSISISATGQSQQDNSFGAVVG